MPLNPGHDVVTFSYDGVAVDRLHKVAPVPSTSFTQQGCFVQPLSVKDKPSNTAYSEATDRCIAPYNDNMLAVKAEWKVTVNGRTYRVCGCKPHRDNFGRGLHITFIVRDQEA